MGTVIVDNIFGVQPKDFTRLAIDIFHFQYRNNSLYRSFTDALEIHPKQVCNICEIPFLPVGFFKTHVITTTSFVPELIFETSGTTGPGRGSHRIKDSSLYQRSYNQGFENFYGPVEDWCIIGLLPSYLERNNSSLVFMVDGLVKMSRHPCSGFYLNEYEKLSGVLQQLEKKEQKCLVIGVTFALLDFAEHYQMKLKHTLLMETGGMKGRRKELTRPEVHGLLREGLGVEEVHSEYGMTELLSQAYAKRGGIFLPVPWMRVLVRSEDDPLEVRDTGAGMINVIDLANLYSCSFIATEDTGMLESDGSFEIFGRADHSEMRGCSLLLT